MYKLILLIAVSSLLACNNSNNSRVDNDSPKKNAAGLPKDSLARVATFSFVDGCMDNFRVALGEPKAYAFCKCIYDQLKAKNPGSDSVEIEVLAQDTAMVNRLAATCRQP